MVPRVAAFLLLAALSACSGIRADVQADPAVDFHRFRTYAWGGHEGASSPAVDRRIRAAVDAQLAKKGLRRVERDGDLEVSFTATVDPLYDLIAWEHGRGARWGNMPAEVEVQEETVGALQVDLVVPASQRRAWRGRGVSMLPPNPSLDERFRRVDEAASALFRSFPPTGK